MFHAIRSTALKNAMVRPAVGCSGNPIKFIPAKRAENRSLYAPMAQPAEIASTVPKSVTCMLSIRHGDQDKYAFLSV
jgi:hypothetical protein